MPSKEHMAKVGMKDFSSMQVSMKQMEKKKKDNVPKKPAEFSFVDQIRAMQGRK